MQSVTTRRIKSQLALAAAAGAVSLSLWSGSASAADGTWTGTASGSWGDPLNWSGGVIADGDPFVGNFNTVDLLNDITVSLDAPRLLGSLNFADNGPATQFRYILSDGGNAANTLTLSGNVQLTTGLVSLTGTLSALALNTSAGGTFPVPVFSIDGGNFTASALSTINAGTNSSQFIVNSGTANFNGGLRTSNADGAVIRVNGGTLNVNDIFVQRNGGGANSTGSFTSGLMFMGGTVNAGTIRLGTNNSNGAMTIEGANVTATGAVTLGNQTSGDRGGHMRILSGSFTSTDTVDGFVFVRQNGASTANQQSNASFTGGVSTVEKFAWGFDANAIGRGRLNVNGGTLYVGGGGMVQNSTTVVPTITLSSGLLGAKDSWASSLPMVLGTGGNITVQAADATLAARDINLSGIVSGSGNLTKTGLGTLTLSGANTYTGAITVSEGTLAGTTSGLRGNITNNAAVTFDQATNGTFAGVISGTGSVTKTGAGTATLSNPQTYTGATTVAAGTLAINGAQATSGVTVQNGAGLALAGNSTVNALTLGSGAGDAMTLRVNTGTGVNSLGVLTANSLVAHGTTTVDVGSIGLSAGVFPILDYSGAIGGTGGGFAAFTLGSLPPRVAGSLVNNTSGTSIDLNITGVDFPRWTGAANGTWDIGTVNGSGVPTSGTVNWKEVTSGNNTVYLEAAVPGDQVVFDDTATGTTTVNIASTVSPTLVTFNNSTKNYTITGANISGPAQLIKQGTGSLTLSNAGNNYAGGTTLTAGTLQLGAANALPTAGNVNANGGTLNLGGQTQDLSGAFVLDGATVSNGVINKSGANYDLRSGTVTANLSGAVGINKNGPGTVVVVGTPSLTGTTTVNEGNLELGDGFNIGVLPGNINNSGTITFNNGFDQNFSNRIIGLTGTVVKNGPARLIIDNADNTGGNEGNAIINGGIVQLVGGAGANPYNARLGRGGRITINSGATVLVQNTDALGLNTANLPAAVTLNTGGTLRGDSFSTTALYNATFAGGTLSAEDDATWTLRGDYVGAAGTSSNITALNLNIINTPNFNMEAGSALSVTGNMTGASGLEKAGDGSMTLSGTNTYTGGTNVNGGLLVIAGPSALPVGFGAGVGAGGTLRSQAGQTTALDVSSLNVNATGRVDLNDGGLVRRNGGDGATGQATTQQLTGFLKTGLENGGNFDWLGPGISSTEANADNATAGSVLYGLGIVQNNIAAAGSADGTTTDATGGNEIYTSFKGRTVALNDTLVKYTYMGDADLSGSVDSTDYSLIDSGFALSLSGWLNGDFDYSGAIDATDYALIDNAFAFQTGPLSEQFLAMYDQHVAMFGQEYVGALAAVQAVPEPGTLGVLALAGVGLLARRRNRR